MTFDNYEAAKTFSNHLIEDGYEVIESRTFMPVENTNAYHVQIIKDRQNRKWFHCSEPATGTGQSGRFTVTIERIKIPNLYHVTDLPPGVRDHFKDGEVVITIVTDNYQNKQYTLLGDTLLNTVSR